MSAIEQELKELKQESLWQTLQKRNGAALLQKELPTRFAPAQVCKPTNMQRAWELCGLFYLHTQRYYEALAIFEGLYYQMLAWQESEKSWSHKGMPLVWISDCHRNLGHPTLAKRHAMLTLIEDAIGTRGEVDPENTGIYFRLVWHYGLSDEELKRYAKQAHELHSSGNADAAYPEWLLQQFDNAWMREYPTQREVAHYRANLRYVTHLRKNLGDGSGKYLELLAEYLLSVIPGCRTYRRQSSLSTDYDVICSVEGDAIDFRSELGRYFVCECKDWGDPADFTTIAKFCRVLDSVKCRFGILFSREGVSGSSAEKYGARELLKVFQDRGMVIVVIDETDLDEIEKGVSLFTMLRARYEQIRLDLKPKKASH